ncbi:C40 family peptidase [Gemmatimonas sp.]|uniref:C40 family peptidase n=1 Tax=Gemmatimonas sp. TaxID=1962908 RepID=UPI003983AC10
MISLSRQLLSLSLCAALVAIAPCAEGQSLEKLESRKPFTAWSVSAQNLRDSIVAKARGQIGTRYKLGGTKPNLALDCSGLVKYVMGALDVMLPRTAQKQSTVGQEVPKDLAALKPGDLLTFGRGKRISHIGIYVGEGRMVHASTSKRRVIETRITERSPLIRQWKGVRRLVGGANVTMRDSLLAFADSLKQ